MSQFLKPKNFKIKSLIWWILMLGLCLFFLLDLSLGSVSIPFSEVIKILWEGNPNLPIEENIILKIRLPRTLTAVLVGFALSISGLQMQTLFRNPLAGPDILGITAGASLGVALVMLSSGLAIGTYTFAQVGFWQSWWLVISAVSGSALVMGIVLSLALRIRDNVVLLILGMMMSNLTLSLVGIWQYFSSPEQIQDYLLWTFGSLGGVSDTQLRVLSLVVIMGTIGSFLFAKNLNAMLLGENYAQSMGLNIIRSRLIIIALTSILAGSVTAFCGPISFIGIAVPHLSRIWLNTSDHRILIPATGLIGAIILLLCDIIAKMPGSQMTLPINSVTALLGSPVVIWVILRTKNLRKSF